MLQALLSRSPWAMKRAGTLLPGLLLAGAMVSLPAHAQQGRDAPPNSDGAPTETPGPNKDAAGSAGSAAPETDTAGSMGDAGDAGGSERETDAQPGQSPPQGGAAAGTKAPVRPGPVAEPPARYEPLSPVGGRDDTADDGAGMRDPAYFISGVISLSIAGAFAVGGVIALATDDTEPPVLPAAGTPLSNDEPRPQVNQPQTAIGLVGFAAGCATLGVPLLLLGAASERPESPEAVAAGTALATAGVAIAGTGAAFGVAQAAYVDEPQIFPALDEFGVPIADMQGRDVFLSAGYDTDAGPIALPLTLGIAGAAMTVVSVVVWAGGAGEADDAGESGEAGERKTAGKPRPPQGFSAQLTAGPGSLGLQGQF